MDVGSFLQLKIKRGGKFGKVSAAKPSLCFCTIDPHMTFVISTGKVNALHVLLTVCARVHSRHPAFKMGVNSAVSLCHLPVIALISFL